MSMIARWTTPSITFKPSAVAVADVDSIFLVIRQNGAEVMRKDIDDAVITADGFTWVFTQQETALLSSSFCKCTAKIDYKSGAVRYTTPTKAYEVTESAINEVI